MIKLHGNHLIGDGTLHSAHPLHPTHTFPPRVHVTSDSHLHTPRSHALT